MQIKLFDSELKVMELLWQHGELSARKIAELLKEQIQWSKTTTYTVIKKCIEKGAIIRIEPGFICRPDLSIEDARRERTHELLDKMYGGSRDLLIASLISEKELTPEEVERLKHLIDALK